MSDTRHIENLILSYLRSRLPYFSKILHGEALFSQNFGSETDPLPENVFFCFAICSLGFGEGHLWYRLRYTAD